MKCLYTVANYINMINIEVFLIFSEESVNIFNYERNVIFWKLFNMYHT